MVDVEEKANEPLHVEQKNRRVQEGRKYFDGCREPESLHTVRKKCTDPRARLSVVRRLRNAGIPWSIVA